MPYPRKNNALKSIQGHPNKRAFATSPNTKGQPQRPYGLSEGAKKAWDKIVPELIEINAVSSIDETALYALVSWWDIYSRSSKQLAKQKDLTSKEATLLLRTTTNAWENFRKLALEFGLTPKSRTSLEVSGENADELAQFLA